MDNNSTANRKRSSLKQNLFPEGVSYEEYINQHKTKKLQWDSKVVEETDSSHKVKFKEADTPYKEVDSQDDLYLKRLHEINQIKPTV